MSRQRSYMRIVSGEARGAWPAIARAGLALLEPLYAAVIRRRNRAFDTGLQASVALDRPVVSVGNITVGGTGKTPLVARLCQELLKGGHKPAVLTRGYRSQHGQKGDEQRLLEMFLGRAVPVEANPDRVQGARAVLARRPDVDLFVLDDGFQHRRVRRAVDLVLIDATRPFGFERLLPRGLLREPLESLARASAILITRGTLAGGAAVAEIRARVKRYTEAPIFEASFASDGYLDAAEAPLEQIPGGKAVAVCGIGNPEAFVASLRSSGIDVTRVLAFDDHHAYTPADVSRIESAARQTASPVLTTGKDWVKLAPLWPATLNGQLYIAQQRVEFVTGDAERLLKLILRQTFPKQVAEPHEQVPG